MMSLKVTLQLLVLSLVFTIFTAYQARGEKDCYHQRDTFKHECMETIKINQPYKPPSDECIYEVKLSDMICICRILTKDDEKEIAVDKVIRLAAECYRPLPAGSKCGCKFPVVLIFLFLLLLRKKFLFFTIQIAVKSEMDFNCLSAHTVGHRLYTPHNQGQIHGSL